MQKRKEVPVMRKIYCAISILLCMVLVCGCLPAVLAAESGEEVLISSLDDFLEFAENCRLDSYSQGKHFRLTVDIDLEGTDFDGIPIFSGTFDGANHTISGLHIHSAGSVKGLFRYLEIDAVVKDLQVTGSIKPSGSRSQIGGIAGSNAGRIENCSFSGTVITGENVGGIAGINMASGVIDGCAVTGTISGTHFVGGITGSNEGIVENCKNSAGVNITAQQNDIDISDINLGILTNTETAATTTDIGGIAGYNSGVLRGCVNSGAVGYKHIGYNVGGIVGMQAGYVADCENLGPVSGRKEVGGIAGQQEPQVILRYDTDTLQILKGQLAVLSGLIDEAVANGNANTARIRNLIYKLESYMSDIEDALDSLHSGLQNPSFEDLQSCVDALKTIRDCLEDMNDTMRKLWNAVDDTTTDLSQDLKAIAGQMDVIESTLNNAEDHLGGDIVDISDEDTAEDLISKIENCRNLGAILGDLSAGGIVGSIAFENDLDPEEDITVVGNTTLNAVGSFRSVVLGCTNAAAVTAKNQFVGGIAGIVTIGLIRDCVNTGNLINNAADYVGGIAGDCYGYLRDCKVKCVLSGTSSIGGIAGRGAVVSNCAAMVSISGTEKAGAILGIATEPLSDTEDPIVGNYYMQFIEDPGAIDGISYDGNAQGMSQINFLEAYHDCPIFAQVTISFIANGEVIFESTRASGSSVTIVPPVPEKEGCFGKWKGLAEADLDNVLFDLTFTAEYSTYAATLQSDLDDEKGRPVLLIQGSFSDGAFLCVKELEGFAALSQNQHLIQAWTFTAENVVSIHAGRLLIPEKTDLSDVILLVQDKNGDWIERVYSTDGSYLVFALSGGDQGVALVHSPQKSVLSADLLIAGGAGALLVLLIVCAAALIQRMKRKKAAK